MEWLVRGLGYVILRTRPQNDKTITFSQQVNCHRKPSVGRGTSPAVLPRFAMFVFAALVLVGYPISLPLMPRLALPFWCGKKEAKTALWLCRLSVVEQCREGGDSLTPPDHRAKIASKLADAQTVNTNSQ